MSSALRRAVARVGDALLDPTIVFSFDRTGYRRHAVRFEEGDLDVDLRGRVVAVTGANGGLGKAVARALALLGAEVWMLCRSTERGRAAQDALQAETGRRFHLALCDLSDLASIDAVVDGLPRCVDVLVHNAGALLDERRLTPDGLELTLATHLVGPLRLTVRLLDRLSRPPGLDPGRVIWVSSGGMYPRTLSVDALARTSGPFDGVTAYADVKRAQVVLSELLADHLAQRNIVSNAMHPGWADTGGVQDALPRFHSVTRPILRTPEQGADTIVWLAACQRIAHQSGGFWFDRQAVSTHLLRTTRAPEDERARFWEAALQWARVSPDEL